MKRRLLCGLVASCSLLSAHAENEIPTGDYFFRNNATGMFLKAGHDWGVMAAMGKHGKRFTYEVVNEQYKLNTNLSGDNMGEHWFRGDCWIDNGGTPLQISWVDEARHLVRIKNTENGEELCQNYPWETSRGRFSNNYNDWDERNRDYVFLWQALTREDMLAELTSDAFNNGYPKDATFMIECWDFGRHDDGPAALWQGLCEDGQSPRDILDWGGNWGNYVGQKRGVSNYDIHQTLTGLPNGIYQLRVQGFYRGGMEGQVARLYANGAETALKDIHDGSNPGNCEAAGNAFNNGEYRNAVTVEVTDGTLRLGIKANGANTEVGWCVFDNFELYYYGSATTVAAVEADEPIVPNGTYLFRNAQTGLYISQGHDWGTQLATRAENGLNIKTTYQGDGKYTLDSQVFENAGSHFIGTNGYIDGGAFSYTLRRVADGRYAIQIDDLEAKVIQDNQDGRAGLQFIGLVQTPQLAQWELITPETVKAEMAGASGETHVNATPLVLGSNFGRHDEMVKTWQGNFSVEGQGDNLPNYVGQSKDSEVNVAQQLTDMPNGLYIVKVQAFSRNSNAILFANGVTADVADISEGNVPGDTRAAGEAFNNGEYPVELKVWVTGGTLELGIKASATDADPWVAFDNFKLEYCGTDLVLEDKVEMAAFDADMTISSFRFDRQVKEGQMVTFILPVAVPADKLNGAAYELTATHDEYLTFTPVEGATEANKPYILLPAADGDMVAPLGETLLPATPATLSYKVGDAEFFGTYSPVIVNSVYGIYQGEFVGANNSTLAPFRAAISIENGSRSYNVVLGDGATGIGNIDAAESVKAGQDIYNLAGQRVVKAQKGVYIIGGKKVMR